MRSNFERAFDILMDLEGCTSDHPSDKGGLTKYGIAQNYHPEINVADLTLDDAKDIYLKDYWIPLECDEIQFPFDIAVFVQGVNVWTKAKAYYEQSNGLLDFFMFNLNYYSTRPADQRAVFLTGWNNRLIKLWKAISKEV
jgi:hypothetical protein